MFVYKITNKINNKQYIGITNDYERRWKEHQHLTKRYPSIISKAIKKYGAQNFNFELLEFGLSIKEAEEKEIELISVLNTLTPNGYNIAKGGMHGGRNSWKITDEEIQYIKDNRNIPMYVLYDEFSEKICYGYFKQIYRDEIRKDITPSVSMYSDNKRFSLQFVKTKMTYEDIVFLRKSYSEHKSWDEVYPLFKDKVVISTFVQIYNGRRFSLIMPEVFTEENKHFIMSKSNQGEKNSHAKLNKEQVKEIRRLSKEEHKTYKEINKKFPFVSYSTIVDIITYRSWKHI